MSYFRHQTGDISRAISWLLCIALSIEYFDSINEFDKTDDFHMRGRFCAPDTDTMWVDLFSEKLNPSKSLLNVPYKKQSIIILILGYI